MNYMISYEAVGIKNTFKLTTDREPTYEDIISACQESGEISGIKVDAVMVIMVHKLP